MSGLQDRLDRIREGVAKQAPAAAVEVIHRANEIVRASGILERMPKVGDTLPPFELEDTEGQLVRSADVLVEGPLVVTFYRGLW